MKAEVERLGAQVADLNAALEAEQTARAAAVREAKEKGEKLERLEGGMGGGAVGVARFCWSLAWGLWCKQRKVGQPGMGSMSSLPLHIGPKIDVPQLPHRPLPTLPQASWRRCRSAPSVWGRATRRRC